MTIQTSSDLDDLRDLVWHCASLGNSQDFYFVGSKCLFLGILRSFMNIN